MKIDPGDRIGGPDTDGRSRAVLLTIVAVLIVAGAVAAFLFKEDLGAMLARMSGETAMFTEVYEHLEIEPLPASQAARGALKKSLTTLQREKCDTAAMFELATAMGKEGFHRRAARSLVTFSQKCGRTEQALAAAYRHYVRINDHTKMTEVADRLVELKDFSPKYHYWRGLGHMNRGDHSAALDDFITTVALEPDIRHIRSTVFTNQSKMYEELGRICEAITPIQTWIAIDPAKRDTPQTRTLISRLSERGKCDTTYAAGNARFPVANASAILVEAEINGTKARLLLDTGASFVALAGAFAREAGIEPAGNSHVKLQSANGVVTAGVGIAPSVSVAAATARNVTVVIMDGDEDAFGPGIDGLLGMSFLARFNLQISQTEWSLAARDE